MLHEDFCLRAHLHVLVYVSVHADLVSELAKNTVCVFVCLRAYFQSLVFHFHDELLLLFLSGTGFLKLGLDAVDLHLILHDCRGKTAGGSHTLTAVTQLDNVSFTHYASLCGEEQKPERDDDVA